MLTQEIAVTHQTPLGRCRHGAWFRKDHVRHYGECADRACLMCHEIRAILRLACPFAPAEPVRASVVTPEASSSTLDGGST